MNQQSQLQHAVADKSALAAIDQAIKSTRWSRFNGEAFLAVIRSQGEDLRKETEKLVDQHPPATPGTSGTLQLHNQDRIVQTISHIDTLLDWLFFDKARQPTLLDQLNPRKRRMTVRAPIQGLFRGDGPIPDCVAPKPVIDNLMMAVFRHLGPSLRKLVSHFSDPVARKRWWGDDLRSWSPFSNDGGSVRANLEKHRLQFSASQLASLTTFANAHLRAVTAAVDFMYDKLIGFEPVGKRLAEDPHFLDHIGLLVFGDPAFVLPGLLADPTWRGPQKEDDNGTLRVPTTAAWSEQSLMNFNDAAGSPLGAYLDLFGYRGHIHRQHRAAQAAEGRTPVADLLIAAFNRYQDTVKRSWSAREQAARAFEIMPASAILARLAGVLKEDAGADASVADMVGSLFKDSKGLAKQLQALTTSLELCDFCGKESSAKDLKRCSRCRSQRYCSPSCQKAAWTAGHKRDCVDFSLEQPKKT